jgi:hypothetical protein
LLLTEYDSTRAVALESTAWGGLVDIPTITGFELHDAAGNVYPLSDGTQLMMGNQQEPLMIYALAGPNPIGSVRMMLGTIDDHIENDAPYTTESFTLAELGVGTSLVIATPYSDPDGHGWQGITLGIAIVVVNSTPTPTPTPVPSPSPGSSGSATFVKTDTTTQGNWEAIYGAEGYNTVNDVSSYPGYAQVIATGQQGHIWESSTSDVRALQRALVNDRLAAAWYADSFFTIDVNLTDGATHQVALYCLDWDYFNRSQELDVRDAATNVLLDSRAMTSFSDGQYLVWNITGHVKINVTLTGGTNAVVSGIYFGSAALPGPTPTPTPDTTPPIISAVSSSGITLSGATISWYTNEGSDTQLEYGLTTGYGSSTSLNTSMVTSHSAGLSGLLASTLYHYRVKSRDRAGNLATSGDFTFTTSLPSSGASYYVATTGNDSNPGSLTQPFRSLSKGVSLLRPGDTLFVRAGSYVGLASKSGGPTIPAGTSWSSPVAIKSYPGESVTISVAGGEFCLAIENTSYVVIDGLILDGQNAAFNGAKIRFGAHHIRIQNSEIKNAVNSGILLPDEGTSIQGFDELINLDVHNNGTRPRFDHGVYLSVPNCLIENSSFHNNAAYGIQLDNGPANNTIIRYNKSYANTGTGYDGGGLVITTGTGNLVYNNLFYNNAGVGISISYNPTGVKIYNNTVYGNSGDGMYFYQGAGGLVRDNISYSNGRQLVLESTSNITLGNNLTGAAITRVGDVGSTLASNLTGNPLFANAGGSDFHLQASSPAVNQGMTLTEVPNDFDRVLRPQSGAYDIGAYEFH